MNDLLAILRDKADQLAAAIPLQFRYSPRRLRDPLNARPRASWPVFRPGSPGPWVKNGPNWFYADVAFPRSRCGLRLAGGRAMCFVDGWAPFTAWLDGRELWKETHVWNATGPIADPFPFAIDPAPAKRHRLVLCVRPTELPNNSVPVGVTIRLQEPLELAWELQAARMQLLLAKALARTAGERRTVGRAAACLDGDDIARHRWGKVRRSIERMEEALAPLSPRAKELTVHVLGHSHIDMDWMWTWPDTVHCIRRDFKAVTDMMDDDPEVTFTHSQAPTYDVVRRMDPAVFAKVRRRMAEGRWENAAGTWVEGDLNMADGESIARHVLYAADWTARHLGARARIFWAPDTFGHPPNMPQLARLGQLEAYYHRRCNPDRHEGWPAWEWTGVDGTSIPTFCCPYGGDLSPEGIVTKALHHLAFGQDQALHLWGLGDHGGALGRYQLAMLARYRDKPLIPTVRFSTLSRILRAVKASRVKLPGHRGETYTLFQGCFTTHASLKRLNRRCEGDLLTAETLTALAGLDRRDALRGAWTDALFNHFHDLLDGAAVHDSYADVHKRAESALRAARKLTAEAVRVIARPSRGGRGVTVMNPLGFERTGPVRVKLPADTACLIDPRGLPVAVQRIDGEHVFIAEGVPAMSQKTWRIARRAPKGFDPEPVRVTDACRPRTEGAQADERGMYYTVETPHALMRIRRSSGVIGSYFDKALGRELVGYGVPIPLTHVPTTRTDLGLNVFEIADESPNGMSAWLIHDVRRSASSMPSEARGSSRTSSSTATCPGWTSTPRSTGASGATPRPACRSSRWDSRRPCRRRGRGRKGPSSSARSPPTAWRCPRRSSSTCRARSSASPCSTTASTAWTRWARGCG